MTICAYCKQERSKFSEEHIVPAGLGGTRKLIGCVCEECNNAFSRDFERDFLKGKGFIALMRSHAEIAGRKGVPVYGKKGHGFPFYLKVKEGYPEIRLYLKKTIIAPMQLIIKCNDNSIKRYDFHENFSIHFKNVLEEIIDNSLDYSKIKKVYLWFEPSHLTVKGLRLIEKGFKEWIEDKKIDGEIFEETYFNKKTFFTLDWNPIYQTRFFCKTLLNYLFSKIEDKNFRLATCLDPIREFVRRGGHYNFLQWNGAHPDVPFIKDKRFTLMLFIFETNKKLIGLIHIVNLGTYVIKIAAPSDINNNVCFLTLYTYKTKDYDDISLTDALELREAVLNHPTMGPQIKKL